MSNLGKESETAIGRQEEVPEPEEFVSAGGGRPLQIQVRHGHRIGLALGSGSARGWSHIGVIKGLLEIGIRPQVVVGSSIGSLVAAAYVCDFLDEFEQWVLDLSWREVLLLMDVTLRGGFLKGERLFRFFREKNRDSPIESLPTRFAAVATDMDSGKEVWLQEGSVLEAVRASAALPGLFKPVLHQGRWLIDGGLVNPVPVSVCQALGADLVIAVDLNAHITGRPSRRQFNPGVVDLDSGSQRFWQRRARLQKVEDEAGAPGVVSVMASAINIMQDRITRGRMAGTPPDLLLTPRLEELGMFDYHRGAIAIREGKEVVMHASVRLRQLLAD